MTATDTGCASSAATRTIEPPFLFADASHWQGDSPDWALLARYCTGIVLKATQGMYYAPSWFVRHWQPVRDAFGERYGGTAFRGAYHFLDLFASGSKQADIYLDHIERAGGWSSGDILPIVDVELGGGNRDASAQQAIGCVEAFAARCHERAGHRPILYGRGAMRDLAIRSRMGCSAVWNPGYTRTMPTSGLVPTWSVDDIVLWQYTDGTHGDASEHSLPLRIPGWSGGLDLSVYVDGARKPTMESLRARLLRP